MKNKNTGVIALGMIVAIILDSYGILCLLFYKMNEMIGMMMSGIGSLFGVCFFAFWIGKISGKGGFSKNKKMVRNFLFTALGENLPFVGGAPLWIIFVIKNSIRSRGENQNIIIETTGETDEEEEEDEFDEPHAEEDLDEEEEEEETKEDEAKENESEKPSDNSSDQEKI